MRRQIKQWIAVVFSLYLCSHQLSYAQYHPDTSLIKPNGGSIIWPSIRDHFYLKYDESKPAIQKQIRWYRQNPTYLTHTLAQAAPYLSYIFSRTCFRDLPAELALLPFVESEFNPFAYSQAGAVGLWQFMPGTASGFGVPIDWWFDGRRDVILSTRYALDYLSYLCDYFHHEWLLAIAAYDAGEGTVSKAVNCNVCLHKDTCFWSLPLPGETTRYVPKLLALISIIKHPRYYHIHLPDVRDAPYFDVIDLEQQMQLSNIAKNAHIDTETLRSLNPGFRRATTGPNAPYSILLPQHNMAIFRAYLKKNHKQAIEWHHHVVKAGESISTIANKYHTTPNLVKKANNLSENIIYPQQHILVPSSKYVAISDTTEPSRKQEIAADHSPGPKRYVHIIKPGESYYLLAKKYRVKVRSIRYWNNHSSRHQLKPNEQLVIWSTQKILQPHTAWQFYQIKPGDSLSQIAHRYHTDVKQLQRYNKLKTTTIRVGSNIMVPIKIYS